MPEIAGFPLVTILSSLSILAEQMVSQNQGHIFQPSQQHDIVI